MLSLSKKMLPLLFLWASSSLLASVAQPLPLSSFQPVKSPPPEKNSSLACDSGLGCQVGHGLVLSGSFLWWQATENLDSYAQIVTQENFIPPIEKSLGFPKGHDESISYQWGPGFNLRLGWDTNYDCWNLSFDWTHYSNSSKSTVHAKAHSSQSANSGLPATQNGLGIYALWSQEWVSGHAAFFFDGLPLHIVYPGPFKQVSTHWNLSYNTFNLEMGKSLKSKANVLKPFFGIRGAKIERSAKAHYAAYQNDGSLIIPDTDGFMEDAKFRLEGFDSASYKTDMHFWGLGPVLGILDEFRLPLGWRLIGQLSTALIYGNIQGYNEYKLYDFKNAVPSLYDGSKMTNHNKWAPATNIQMLFGVEWGMCFNKKANEILVGAAWEQNIWLFHGYSANVNKGIMNLSLGGLTATAQLKF